MTELQALRDAVGALERRLREDGQARTGLFSAVSPAYRASALNFVHYLLLRREDVRALQLGLARVGLSSLGRLEGHALDAIVRVRERLDDAIAAPLPRPTTEVTTTPDEAERLLHAHTQALLGPRPEHRHVYVMVTAPSAAEVDAAWVGRLLDAGMNVLRINGAHEDEPAWKHIATTARAVAAARGASLRIAVDLPGPKVRTVLFAAGPRVVKWRPVRDELGRVTSMLALALAPQRRGTRTSSTSLSVPDAVFDALRVGDTLSLRDARGKRRVLTVNAWSAESGSAELGETTYLVPETRVHHRREGERLGEFTPGDVDPRPVRLTLAVGERFAWVRDANDAPAGMKALGCSLDAARAAVRVGQRVLFDDGHLEAIVEATTEAAATLRVTYAPGGALRLGAEKGINLPDTELDLPLFSEDDERALGFAIAHADLVDASFVRGPDDVRAIHARLAAARAEHVGLVLKIETRGAFEALPAILLAALERAPVGVMIARGDLAIESGYERLAEVQEEMLWLCEAAHVPVVWATQVLDTLARTGRPSRAEVTDAAMSVRAECVMLNKGPYVADAARALDDILRRMEQHTYKKRSLYRKLSLQLPST